MQAGIASRFLNSAIKTFPHVVPAELTGSGREWKAPNTCGASLKLLLEVPVLPSFPQLTEDAAAIVCPSQHLSLKIPHVHTSDSKSFHEEINNIY